MSFEGFVAFVAVGVGVGVGALVPFVVPPFFDTTVVDGSMLASVGVLFLSNKVDHPSAS